MPIYREGEWLITQDLAHVPCVGIESDRLQDCVDRVVRERYRGVFGSSCYGFSEDNLDFLEQLDWLEAVWFWDVKLASIAGLYALRDLRFFGVHPARPAIDFSRFPRLQRAVITPRARDHGLDALSELTALDLWRCPPRNKAMDSYPLPDSLEEVGLFWSSVSSLAALPALPRLRRLRIARCRNLVSLGDLASKFPNLEHLVVEACGRVDVDDAAIRVRTLPRLQHAIVRDRRLA